MSVALSRHVGLESLEVAPKAGIDGQGLVQYGSPYEVFGRVVREDEIIKTAAGTEVRAVASVWIGADQVQLPDHEDKVTLADGLVGIVVSRDEGRSLRGQLNHVQIRISPVLLGRQGQA